MAGGIHQLPDGSTALMGDDVNVPEDVAERFARGGVGNIFKFVPSPNRVGPRPEGPTHVNEPRGQWRSSRYPARLYQGG